MEHVYFKPWRGDNYQSGHRFGKRVLVLGEAHYEWDKNMPLLPLYTFKFSLGNLLFYVILACTLPRRDTP